MDKSLLAVRNINHKYIVVGKEEREMLVRLYAGEIIMGRITEDDVPAKLKARVHKYLVDMGYFDDVEE